MQWGFMCNSSVDKRFRVRFSLKINNSNELILQRALASCIDRSGLWIECNGGVVQTHFISDDLSEVMKSVETTSEKLINYFRKNFESEIIPELFVEIW